MRAPTAGALSSQAAVLDGVVALHGGALTKYEVALCSLHQSPWRWNLPAGTL